MNILELTIDNKQIKLIFTVVQFYSENRKNIFFIVILQSKT